MPHNLQVISPPPLKLHEWQRIHRAARTLRDLLKTYPWVLSVSQSFWADPGSDVVTKLRVTIKEGTSKPVVRRTVPQHVEGVPVVVIEE